MNFELIEISPVHKRKLTKKIVKETEPAPILSLAPFTAIPKICFDNVLVGTNVSQTLIIYNPTPNNVKLYVTKAPADERCFLLSWVECLLHSQEKVMLELFWQPTSEGGWKDTITFEDGGRIKKDVAVIFKAIKPKKTKAKPKKKVTCVSTKAKSPRKWFSPKRNSPKRNTTQAILPDITNVPQIYVESPKQNLNSRHVQICNENTYIKNKENLDISGIENLSYVSSISDCPNKMLWKNVCNNRITIANDENEENFDDSLEKHENSNITPNKIDKFGYQSVQIPPNIEDKLNALVFTPTGNTSQPSIYLLDERTRFQAMEASNTSSATCNILKQSSDSNTEKKFLNISSSTYTKNTGKILNTSNISSATYTLGRESPDGIIDELLSPNSNTYIMGNLSSSTYTKEGIVPELNFSDRILSPIYKENNQKNEVIYQTEVNYHCEINRNRYCLEKIVEESYASSDASQLNRLESRKRRSEHHLTVISPKRKSQDLDSREQSFRGAFPKKNFQTIKELNLKQFLQKSRESLVTVEEDTIQSHLSRTNRDTQSHSFALHDPFILTTINSIDPFMSATMYYDPRWVDEQERSFKKWLNALLTPPAELDSNTEGNQLDVAKLWQHCKKSKILKAPTKEAVSSKYHTKGRLDLLRRNAGVLFKSAKISEVLSKVCMMIENQKLVIRDDKDVHLDTGLQAEIVILFLSYNPLWLRIGLETVYNMPITLHSNSDVTGLIMFISEHFFKDHYLLKKYKSIHSRKYAVDIKKLILKRFMMLIFFLDKAKEIKLIPHDPCLFCKNAPYKESRDIILKFSRELLSSMGDITKVIKHAGYVLHHKQTYIHEFDYAVNNLGADLRDGVRLTRVMEIILIVDGLTNKLRVPAISRLQKVHNMKIVFDALTNSGFAILHEIEPKDIVDGHKEKTLSFLWQIIYKFQAPRINKSVVTIQSFWRSLNVVIKRRILARERLRREQAALKIQQWYRRILLYRKLNKIIPVIHQVITSIRRDRAVTTIQSYFKMVLTRKFYLNLRRIVIGIQSYSRRYLLLEKVNLEAASAIKIQSYFRMLAERKQFLKLKAAAIFVGQTYLAKRQRASYLQLQQAACLIQTKFRNYRAMRIQRLLYLDLKQATIAIQIRFRATKLMRVERNYYLSVLRSVIVIQQKYRANRNMRVQKKYYEELRLATTLVQQRFRANKQMSSQKKYWQKLRASTILIQQRFRTRQQAILMRNEYQRLKQATLIIQKRFRANVLMVRQRSEYLKLKCTVEFIQVKYRATRAMRRERTRFLILKRATISLKNRLKANLLMENERNYYKSLRNATITVQRRYRAKKLMELERAKYLAEKTRLLKLKAIALRIEQRYLAKRQRRSYLQLKRATCLIQMKFRANQAMRAQRLSYSQLKWATSAIQIRFRANKLMQVERVYYLSVVKSAVLVQRKYRANKSMTVQKKYFQQLRSATISVQQRFRANREMLLQRKYFKDLRTLTILIQRRFRARQQGIRIRNNYETLKQAVFILQTRFRANILMIQQRKEYLKLKSTVELIQVKYRANRAMKYQRSQFLQLKKATINLQRNFKARKLMENERSHYRSLKDAVITMQRRYRSNKLMELERAQFVTVKRSVLKIQRWYRRILIIERINKIIPVIRQIITIIRKEKAVTTIQSHFRMVLSRNFYLNLRRTIIGVQSYARRYLILKTIRLKTVSVIKIQSYFRMFTERKRFLKLKAATTLVQQTYLSKRQRRAYLQLKRATRSIQIKFRNNRVMKAERLSYLELKRATIAIQIRFKATKSMQIERSYYLSLIRSTIFIQRKYRAKLCMTVQKKYFQELKSAAIQVQKRIRANKEMLLQRKYYQQIRISAILIQGRFRARQQMILVRNNYETIKRAAFIIQTRFRANMLMTRQRNEYLKLKYSVELIQAKYRANKAMKYDRSQFLELKGVAINIQNRYRAKKLMEYERNRYKNIRDAVVMLQRRFRANKLMELERAKFLVLKRAVLIVEIRYISRKLAREQETMLQILNRAALCIQNYYRSVLAMRKDRQYYLNLKNTVILMQRRFRANQEDKKRRNKYIQLHRARANIIIVQAYVRGFLARKIFNQQHLPVLVENKRKRVNERKAATKIQACWRGYRTRSLEEPKLKEIRKRVKIAADRVVVQKTLAYKKERALNIMAGDDSTLDQIIAALQDLDYETRLFKQSSVDLSECLSEELYKMITTSSRSLPEMQSCTAAASILVNFCKHSTTINNCWYPEYIDRIFTVMMHWCDKDCPLFLHLCTLVWLLAADEKRRKFILSIPNISHKFSKIRQLCERKQNMLLRVQYNGPNMFDTYKHLPVPSTEPDWGLDYKKRPRMFKNAVHAMRTLFDLLNFR